MALVSVGATGIGTALQNILMADDIVPGAEPSYQLCKEIYIYHPLGRKLAESPIAMSQSQDREIAVPDSPEERVRDAFIEEWRTIGADKHIFNTMSLSRVYGIASIAMVSEKAKRDEPIDFKSLYKTPVSFNVFDPLNTAGSLVLNQDPNAVDFQHVVGIAVSGRRYHRSRTCVMMNGNPIYIAYTTSAFGFVGRSVYQPALYPLKSFIESMRTDDMVVRKAGLLIAMMKQAGSIIDNVMQAIAGTKRQLLKEAQTDNVLSVGHEDKIETLNMQNLDGAFGMARRDILENIAASDDMPAKLLNSETFAEGFGEGTEDAKNVARYVDRFRIKMQPLYAYFDKIVMHRAWNPEFYEAIQREYPGQYGGVSYNEAFYRWRNSFSAQWPSLLTEPPSERVKVDDVRLKAVIALAQILMPALDPENRAAVIQWACDNFNELKLLFSSPLALDFEALADYQPPIEEGQGLKEPHQPRPFAAQDAIAAYERAVERLVAPRLPPRKDAA